MHVMHVIDGLAIGGAERVLIDLANRTAADGHAVSVCVTRSDCTLASELRRGIGLHVLGRRSRFDWNRTRQLGPLAERLRPDVLHVHGRSSMSFVTLARMIRLVRAPVIFHDQFGKIELDGRVPFWFRATGCRYMDQYVGSSPSLGAWAAHAGIEPSQIHVIGNAPDLRRIQDAQPTRLEEEFGLPADSVKGIVACGVRPEKGILVLLEALKAIRSAQPVKVLIVGGVRDARYYQECEAHVANFGLTEAVKFVGERTDVPSLMKGADFAVMPSLSESGPVVLAEFMAAGLPFVSTRTGEVAARVEALGVPEFVRPGDPHALSDALNRLLGLSADERQSRGRHGQSVAFKYLDIQRVMPQWYEVYQLASRNKSPCDF
jgi:glycosyltransferase involved in cell wall biosynthesis